MCHHERVRKHERRYPCGTLEMTKIEPRLLRSVVFLSALISAWTKRGLRVLMEIVKVMTFPLHFLTVVMETGSSL